MFKKQLFLSVICCTLFHLGSAAYLRNVPQTLIQPDGDTLYCFASGDEFYNYLHDAEGYTIIQNPHTGYYVYAAKEGEGLVATNYIAGRINPAVAGLVPNLNLSPNQILAKREAWLSETPANFRTRSSETNHGTIHNIVIFIRFLGDSDFPTPFSTPKKQFNDSTANTVSMYNYFKSASYNQLEIISHFYPIPNGDIILSYEDIYAGNYYRPYNAVSNPGGYSESSKTNREHGLLKRAVDAVKSQISASLNIDYNNDGNVDNICFIIKASAGGWNDLLWPHRWSLFSQSAEINGKRVMDYNFNLSTSGSLETSTLCHEMFHTLGAPDLYHYNQELNLTPVGQWDLMERNTTIPQHSGAYVKRKYGNWIDEPDIVEITTAGTYTLLPLASGKKNVCYKIASENPNQYYYFEYRHRNSSYFESGIPGNGLLIYRIDTDCNPIGPCAGNSSYDGYGTFDEIYIFRPGGFIEKGQYGLPIAHDGNIKLAHFSTAVNRSDFNETTDPHPFLSDGTLTSLDISDIIDFNGDSLRFTYNTSKQIDVSNQNLNLPNKLYQSLSFVIESNTVWSIRSTGNWFTLNKTSGKNNDTITLSVVGYNSSENYRYDSLLIRGVSAPMRKVYVRQDGFSFSVTPDTIEVSSVASTRTVTVNTEGNNWNLLDYTLSCNWLTATPRNGSGETEVTISTQNFTGTGQRNCTLVFLSAGVMKFVEVVQTDRIGVNEMKGGALKIYPNPVDNILYVNNEDLNRNIIGFSLYDIYGRVILQNHHIGNVFDIDIKKYENGIYLMQIQFDDHSSCTSKVIKQ